MAIGTKVLARWPGDGSVRVALVQFIGMPKPYTFDTATGARTTTDRALVAVTWRYPRRGGRHERYGRRKRRHGRKMSRRRIPYSTFSGS